MFAGGNVVALILRVAGGLIIARLIAPDVLGKFNALSLVLGYVPFLQLGIINGLNRELPYYFGLGDKAKAHRLAASAEAWALIVGAVAFVALMAVAIWQLHLHHPDLAFGWATQAWLAFHFTFIQLYLQVTYRTSGSFSKLTKSNVAQAVGAFSLIILVWPFKFYGLCLRAIGASLIASFILWRWRPMRLRPSWHFPSLKQLLKVGAPIIAVGQVYTWWATLDSTLVLKFQGMKGLGLYAVATMASASLELISASLSQICYPKMAEEYGRTKSMKAIARIVAGPTRWLTLGYALLAVVGWFIAPPAIRVMLPKYIAATHAVQWTFIAAAFLAISPVNLLFIVLKRMDLYLAATLIGIGVYAASVFLLHHSHPDLTIFPKALIIGRICFFLASFALLRFLGSTGKYEPQY